MNTDTLENFQSENAKKMQQLTAEIETYTQTINDANEALFSAENELISLIEEIAEEE